MLDYRSPEQQEVWTTDLRYRLVKIQIIQTPLMTTTQIIQTTVPWMAPGKLTDYNLHTIYILSHFRAAEGEDFGHTSRVPPAGKHIIETSVTT